MFHVDDVIDGKYVVDGVCSESGGMGTVLFVNKVGKREKASCVLKYCKITGEEMLSRFRREVRLMTQFNGNGYVMPILDSNLEHDPPYFVMPYFELGDLSSIADEIRADLSFQEVTFNSMIDCISELHAKDVLHRDIKPQNFLVNGAALVVSDLGLCSEVDSPTAFTRSSMWWGTPGYLPPEFLKPGGFKSATIPSDIFMLGKTFYYLLSGRDPMYLLPDAIPGALFAVIERCCVVSEANRYQSLASLRQSLTAAYDVLLGRAVGSALAIRTLRSITDRLKASQKYLPKEVTRFIEELAMLDSQDKIQICLDLPEELFGVLSQEPIQSHVMQFLAAYREMAEVGTYGWSFAEEIATNMQKLFLSDDVGLASKAEALRVAIVASYRQNRFAAMDTCRAMITGVVDNDLAQRVHDVMIENPHSFIMNIVESSCKAPAIRSALVAIKNKE